MPILQKVQNVFKKDKETDATVDDAVSPESPSPVFDDKKVTVIYVLGGPGAGRWRASIRMQAFALLTLL